MNPIRRAFEWLRESEPLEEVPDALELERADVAAHEWLAGAFPELALHAGTSSVSTAAAFGLPAFYRALRIKCSLISTLPLRAEIGDRQLEVTPRILEQPDPSEDRQLTISRLISSIAMFGEAVMVPTEHDLAGATALKVVDPRHAILEPDRGRWDVNGELYGVSEVLHVMPFAMPGQLRGAGAIALHRRRLAAQLRATDYQDAFYRDGGSPGTLLSVAKPGLSVDDMNELAQWWDHELKGARKAIVVDGDTTATPWTLNNRDAQFIETMNYSLAECALMIGVPPYFVGAEVASGTYTNAHFERRNLIDIHLRDELYAIERAFTRTLPEDVKAKFDPTSFLRLDPQSVATTLAQQPWLTADEKRAVMGYPPLTDEQRAELYPTTAPSTDGVQQ